MAGVVTVEGWPQRGGPTPEEQEELSEHLSPLSDVLEWSVEPFSIQSGDGDGSLWVETQVGDGDEGWRDLCQCLALGRRLSRLRPNWTWRLTDDSRQMEQRFKVCELGLKDGKIQRLAGWAAVDDGELQAEVDQALKSALGERLLWIRRGEPPESVPSVETEIWTEPTSQTVESVTPQVETESMDPEIDELTEPDLPTVLTIDSDAEEARASLDFIETAGPPPETVIHRPGEPVIPVDPGSVEPEPKSARPHLDSSFAPGAQAAEGLQLLGAVQKLRNLIQHSDPAVRQSAVEVIGAMAGPAIALILRPMLADPDAGVRDAAQQALLELKS